VFLYKCFMSVMTSETRKSRSDECTKRKLSNLYSISSYVLVCMSTNTAKTLQKGIVSSCLCIRARTPDGCYIS
jgi:hypothetical protein